MFSVITNIYNNKTKGPTLMELFTATGKLKIFFFVVVNNSINVGPLVFFAISVCNHREHYETSCILLIVFVG
jgi:hypothetical protein